MQGSEDHPIELLDDDEEKKANQQKIEYERNRQALYQAHMGSQFDVLMAVIKLEIKGTDQEKNRVLKSRILKFFNHGSKSINVENEYFRKRREPDYSNPDTVPVGNELILYGVDFLNAKQVKHKFASLSVETQWLDDSHCRVKFQNANDARIGLEMNLKNKADDLVKIENEDLEIPRVWFELKPYTYMTLQRRLFVRYAASNQSQLQIEKSNDFYMYQEAKKKFEQSIREQVTELRYYEVMKKYKLVNEGKLRQRISNRNREQNNRENRGYRDSYDRRDRDQGSGWGRNRDEEGNFNRNRRNFRGDQENNFGRNKNYGYNRGQRDGQQDRNSQYDRSRNKDNRKNNDELDNLSIVSEAVSRASNRQRRQRKPSLSICSKESPVRQKNDDEDAKSSYSFIFNLNEQSSNSQQFLKNFNNLSIDENQQQPKLAKIRNAKEEQLNLSIISNENPRQNRNVDLNLSINLPEDKSMRKKKDINTSIVIQESSVKPNKKMNLSIEQITIYD